MASNHTIEKHDPVVIVPLHVPLSHFEPTLVELLISMLAKLASSLGISMVQS